MADEPLSDSVPRCRFVSPSPWGLAQCVLPDGHDGRHAFSPSETIRESATREWFRMPPSDVDPRNQSAAAVIRDPDGKLRVQWPEGVDTVPIDELALRLLIDLANAGIRNAE